MRSSALMMSCEEITPVSGGAYWPESNVKLNEFFWSNTLLTHSFYPHFVCMNILSVNEVVAEKVYINPFVIVVT